MNRPWPIPSLSEGRDSELDTRQEVLAGFRLSPVSAEQLTQSSKSRARGLSWPISGIFMEILSPP